MFFERRDPVAIHVLIASAHQILTDIGNERGIKGLLKKGQPLNYGSF